MQVLNTPGMYQRLYEELAAAFKDTQVSISGTRELALLNACINESLRLMNPFPSGGLSQFDLICPHLSTSSLGTGRECPAGGRV